MARINSYIENYQPMDYAGTDASACTLDCSLGVNFWKLPERVLQRAQNIPPDAYKHYPHGRELLPLLIERYAPIAKLDEKNLMLGCGSFDLLCNLNLLYAGAGKRILGHAPQFSAYVDNAHCIGADYRYYPLDAASGYRFDAAAFAQQIRTERPALVCCENPNNPTGQALTRADMAQIIRAAADVDAAIVFDEAYGDYLPMEQSAIAFVPEHDHVFVTRTFSKGYGMAGLRIGYTVGPAYAVGQLGKLVTPFNCNEPARRLAIAMLSEGDYLAQLQTDMAAMNERLYAAIRADGKLKIAHTAMTTPICLLYVADTEINLHERLVRAGIATVSGLSYIGLGRNAVRMMLCDQPELLIRLLHQAAELL